MSPASPLRKSPTAFGRRAAAVAIEPNHSSLADDLRIFVLFFAGGFTFMGVYLA
ncbi:hypothetical protein [Sphingomonas mesophila]|uniref:hypothetical protein n=1 Tax=Sphingomonas mesophila TaxID=2303576 RepID=UPI0013C30CB2|nr:hypothetical protein [Sphingomonas mesophila]